MQSVAIVTYTSSGATALRADTPSIRFIREPGLLGEFPEAQVLPSTSS